MGEIDGLHNGFDESTGFVRYLITADWQCHFQNLTSCRKAAERVLGLCSKHNLEAVVVAGDLKDVYNPIDLRVIDFWREFISQILALKAKPILLLGNHDRASLYEDERNWLPLLRDAGAVTVDETAFIRLSDGRLFMLPFISNGERWSRAISWLDQNTPDSGKDDLAFHLTLTGARFNRQTVVDPNKGVAWTDLKPERYRYCLGGDIHLPQRVSRNIWYVGSPFPIDWGEVNQTKVFGVVLDDGLHWVPTGMPGWYDPDMDGFNTHSPVNWEGTRIRIHVPVQRSDDYANELSEAKLIAEQKYSGAAITVLPKFVELSDTVDNPLRLDQSEHEQIESYIRQAFGDALVNGLGCEREVNSVDMMVSYIEFKLRETHIGSRSDKGVRFRKAWAEKFLSFEELQIDFSNPGITVVTGRNMDWGGRSNGAGKTNLFQILPVALFGKTFKGQQADAWAERGSEGRSLVGVEFELADGSLVRVERTRNPVSVRLWVNGNEISAGSRSADVSKDVETLSGYSWDTFSTLIYLSSEEVDFLWGTPEQKQKVLAKLQNLERFAAALKLVRLNISELDKMMVGEYSVQLALVKARLKAYEEFGEADNEIDRLTTDLHGAESLLVSLKPEPLVDPKPLEIVQKRLQATVAKSIEIETERLGLQNRLEELVNLPDRCPKCGQKVHSDVIAKEKLQIATELETVKQKLSRLNELMAQLKLEREQTNKQYLSALTKRNQWEEQRRNCIRDIERLRTDLLRWQQKKREQLAERKELEETARLYERILSSLDSEAQFLRIAELILAKEGLPAYMSQMLYPKINEAAKVFAELFADEQLQIRFHINEGQIVTDVINPYGGANLSDQSSGEAGMLALITSFALREVAPKSNVLVLDEPGDGLDAWSARAFAAGVRHLKQSNVYVMTHNVHIEAELAGEKRLVVEKQNGVSRLISEKTADSLGLGKDMGSNSKTAYKGT